MQQSDSAQNIKARKNASEEIGGLMESGDR
jgi:hypothetical protein